MKVYSPIQLNRQNSLSNFVFACKGPVAGPTLKNERAEVGSSCTGWLEKNSALCSHRFVALEGIARCTRYTATGRRSSSTHAPHSMRNAIIFIWGRILKCFPHPVAGSAARTAAGPTLKNERAEVGNSCTGWLEKNSALCSHRL